MRETEEKEKERNAGHVLSLHLGDGYGVHMYVEVH